MAFKVGDKIISKVGLVGIVKEKLNRVPRKYKPLQTDMLDSNLKKYPKPYYLIAGYWSNGEPFKVLIPSRSLILEGFELLDTSKLTTLDLGTAKTLLSTEKS